jgi:hypothetical protein
MPGRMMEDLLMGILSSTSRRWIVPALTLALAGLPARADTFWTFGYTGFLLKETGEFQPGYRLDGFFAGTDANADGVIAKDELSRFNLNGFDYFEGSFYGCYGSWCNLNAFSYRPGDGQLSFDADWHYSDEAVYTSTRTVTGLSHLSHEERGYPRMDQVSNYTYLWTDQTRFAIAPPPVPEPAMAALLAGGMAVLGVARVRRQRQRAGRA